MKTDLFKQYLEIEIEAKELEAEKLMQSGKLSEAIEKAEVINSLKTTLDVFKLIFSDCTDKLNTTPRRGVTCNAEEQHGATNVDYAASWE